MIVSRTRGPDAGAVPRLLPQRVIELDPSASAPGGALVREDDCLGDLVKVRVVGEEVFEGRRLQWCITLSIPTYFQIL